MSDVTDLKAELLLLRRENAKLWEQIHWLKQGDILHVLTDQELAEQQKHEREMQASIKALDDENARLRELVRDMYEMAYPEYPSAFYAAFADRMRELGVEVG